MIPHLTPKQKLLISTIYQYHFITRKHLQTLYKLKDYHRLNSWLKDLTDKGYLKRTYLPSSNPQMSPPVYHLLPLSRHHLPNLTLVQKQVFLRRIRREADRTPRFIKRCLVVADAACHFASHPELYPQVIFLPRVAVQHNFPHCQVVPDAYLKLSINRGDHLDLRRYLVYVIDEHMGRNKVAHLFSAVGAFYEDEAETCLPHPLPWIMVLVPDRSYLQYVKRVLYAIREEQVNPMPCIITQAINLKGYPQFSLQWTVVD